jgi:uncharacterized protein YjcR
VTTRTPIDKLLARNIRYLKRRDELRIADIAEATGAAYRTVQDWTSDADWSSSPSDRNIEALARLFKVSFGDRFDDNRESRGA